MLPGLKIQKIADRTGQERLVRFDPITGEKKLVNPATEGDDHEPWPLAGVVLLEAPDETTVSTTYVAEARNEGWVTLEDETVVVRPAGPAADPWKGDPHVFHQCAVIVFHTLDGDVRYRVTHQPDKYACAEDATFPDQVPAKTKTDNETPVTPELYAAGATRVDNFYGITKEG